MKRCLTYLLAAGMGLVSINPAIAETKQDTINSRIVNGGGQNSVDPSYNYDAALKDIRDYNYDNAQSHLLKVIDYGPANNPVYFKAETWLRTKLWEHMIESYTTINKAERAAVEILIDESNKDSKNKEVYLKKAKLKMEKIKERESQLERAIKKLGGN